MDNTIEDIYNFLRISDSIATSGQPTEEQFSAISDIGYQVVVNLALPESLNALPHEREIVETLGMQYVHIPVIWENPTFDNVERFFGIMEANTNKSIFVHCAANMRVSAFMYLYHRVHKSMSDEEAKQDLYQIWVPNEVWQKFMAEVVERYG